MIGQYKILGVLGHGGMGVVYRAESPHTGQRVALKTVEGVTASTLASIRREISAMSELRHPGIARVIDHGVHEGRPWYTMELLEGRTLRDYIVGKFGNGEARRTVPAIPATTFGAAGGACEGTRRWNEVPSREATLSIIRGMCGPLGFLHSHGIIHRDLKPENVFIEDGRVVLVDFGIAVRFGDSREYEIGDHGFAGTPAYMAPEQILGRNVDARADLYSIGCLLYECLVGRPPFVGTTASDVIAKQLSSTPRPLSDLIPDIPAALDDLVLRLLAKRPRDRLGYASDLAASLGRLLPQAAPTPHVEPKLRPYVYRPEFVGRADALSRLDDIVWGTTPLQRRALVRGESGLGKTRLLRELAALAAARKVVVIVAQCAGIGASPSGEAASLTAPLQPFRASLTRIADLCREGPPSERARLLGDRGLLLSSFEPSLAEFPGAERHAVPDRLAPDVARARVFSDLRETLYAYANNRPMLLLIDDLQWADELTIGFIASLAPEDLDAHRTSLVCTYRPEDVTEGIRILEALPGIPRLSLERLGADDVGQMMRGMLALRETPPVFTEFMVQQSGGNPFFVAEYLRAAIDHGLLQRDTVGVWRLQSATPEGDMVAPPLPLPASIRELMDRRMAHLEAAALMLMEVASVLGYQFDPDVLHDAAGLDDSGAIQALRRRQILEEADRGQMRFVHDQIRALAYERIAPEQRSLLHRRAAHALESFHRAGPDRAAVLPALALHWSRAGGHDRAAECYTLMGDHARASYAHREALDHYEAAAKALRNASLQAPASSAEWSTALRQVEERVADVLTIDGQHHKARKALNRARSEPAPIGRVWNARLLWKYARTLEPTHRHEEALQVYDQAELVLGSRPDLGMFPPPPAPAWSIELPDESERAWWHQWIQLHVERVWVHYWLADVDGMTVRVERVRSLVEARGTADQRARFFQALTHSSIRRERYAVSKETVSLARTALAAAEETADAAMIAYAQFVLAFQLTFSGSLDSALPMMRSALGGAERTGDLTLQARCQTYLTVLYRLSGDVAMVHCHAARSVEVAGRLAMNDYLGAAHANFGWIAWRQCRFEEAARETSLALEHWRTIASRYPFPFQWLARTPALALALDSRDNQQAVIHARAMLEGVQHRLPDAVLGPFAEGVSAFDRGDEAESTIRLRRGLDGARALGYA